MGRSNIFIPPGGFAGWAQQTVATHALLSPRARRAKTVRRIPGPVSPATRTKRRRAAAPAKRRRSTKAVTRARARTRKKPQRLVKGSAAAKRHMAKLRRMRKR